MTHNHYRLLFAVSLGSTILMLLLPGNCIETLQNIFKGLLFWDPPTRLTPDSLPADKLVHCSMFALCGYLLVKGWTPRAAQLLWPALLLFTTGLVTELLQAFLPGRSMEASDMLANTLGAAAGMALACSMLRREKTKAANHS